MQDVWVLYSFHTVNSSRVLRLGLYLDVGYDIFAPLNFLILFFLFSVYLFDNFLKLNLGEALKKLLVKRKKPLPQFVIFQILVIAYFFSFLFIILISLFSFFNNHFLLFCLYHLINFVPYFSLIPSYSYTRFNSILYSIFIGADQKYIKIDDSSIIQGRHIRPLKLLLESLGLNRYYD